MKKFLIAAVTIGIVVIVAFLGYVAIKVYDRVTNIPADIATRAWSEHKMLENSVMVDFPWPLNDKEAAKNKGFNFKSYEGDGLYVFAGSGEHTPGAEWNLDEEADRFVAICRKTGEVVGTPVKTPVSVAGKSAVDLQLVMKKKLKPVRQVRCLYFVHNDTFCQVQCCSVTNQPVADAVWKRIKQSVRFRQGAPTLANPGITPASPRPQDSGLPPGMSRRQN